MTPDDFIEELRELARAHPIDPDLAQGLKYGKGERAGLRRWAKDYYHYVVHDAQATAATLARCFDRRLFLELSGGLARKAGFFQVSANPLELYQRFTDALDISRDELEAHQPCAETLGALFTKRSFQHSGFVEGFTAFHLCSEGALMEATGDAAPFLAQKGMAEYLRRHFGLPEGATGYWKAYEDFRSFDGERAWEIAGELATDGSVQAVMRRTFRDSLRVYQTMRRAWSDLLHARYWDPEIRWPPAPPDG